MPLSGFLHRLRISPVDAVERSELFSLLEAEPDFYQRIAAPDRWRLLFALGISLLDYAEGLDLEAHVLPLPGGLPSVNLWQICDALACVDFKLNQLDWTEELQPKIH